MCVLISRSSYTSISCNQALWLIDLEGHLAIFDPSTCAIVKRSKQLKTDDLVTRFPTWRKHEHEPVSHCAVTASPDLRFVALHSTHHCMKCSSEYSVEVSYPTRLFLIDLDGTAN